MHAPLPADIEVEDQWPDHILYRLPRRRLGKGRWLALPMILLGFATMLSVACVLDFVIALVLNRDPVGIPGWWPLAMFVGVPTRGGWLLVWWGLGILFGRRELIVTQIKLRTVERIGPLWYGKSWLVNTLAHLGATPLSGQPEEKSDEPAPAYLQSWYALTLATCAGRRGMLAWGYPRALIGPLARAVVDSCNRAVALLSPEVPDEERDLIQVTGTYDQSVDDDDEVDDENRDREDDDGDEYSESHADRPLVQPAGSQIQVDSFDEGATIKVPAAGLIKGSSGLFFFALLWNGVMTLFTTLVVFGAFQANNNQQGMDGAWVMLLFMGVFWLVGILVLIGALNMGLRKAAIAVAGDALMIIQTGPFGTKRLEWPLEELGAIGVGPSGMKVNDVDILELQVIGRDGKKRFGMLSGRQNAELYWLAGVVESAAGLTPQIVKRSQTAQRALSDQALGYDEPQDA